MAWLNGFKDKIIIEKKKKFKEKVKKKQKKKTRNAYLKVFP